MKRALIALAALSLCCSRADAQYPDIRGAISVEPASPATIPPPASTATPQNHRGRAYKPVYDPISFHPRFQYSVEDMQAEIVHRQRVQAAVDRSYEVSGKKPPAPSPLTLHRRYKPAEAVRFGNIP